MKKKSTIFFALLFACTMAFGFGIATTASAGPSPCCVIDGSPYFCLDSIGHWNEDFTICVLNYTSPCDFPGPCF